MMDTPDRSGLPDAYVAYSNDHRLRLKIPSKKGDGSYFDKIGQALSGLEGVSDVRVNPMTTSVLIVHELSPQDIVRFSYTQRLFDTRELSLIEATAREKIKSKLRTADLKIKDLTDGQADLGSIAFLGLVGAGIYEILRGRYTLPSWHQLFWYGANIFARYETGEEGNNGNGDGD